MGRKSKIGQRTRGVLKKTCHAGMPRNEENADEAIWTCGAPVNKLGDL
jgi:hypothetical protein